jgi:hypothetical protein
LIRNGQDGFPTDLAVSCFTGPQQLCCAAECLLLCVEACLQGDAVGKWVITLQLNCGTAYSQYRVIKFRVVWPRKGRVSSYIKIPPTSYVSCKVWFWLFGVWDDVHAMNGPCRGWFWLYGICSTVPVLHARVESGYLGFGFMHGFLSKGWTWLFGIWLLCMAFLARVGSGCLRIGVLHGFVSR